MSTYRNDNNFDVVIGNYRIPAKGVLETKVCFPDSWLPPGVVRISATPIYNPVIVSVILEGNAGELSSVDIPAEVSGQRVSRFRIDIGCISGRVKIKYNVDSFSPAIVLVAGEGWQELCSERFVEKVIAEFLEPGSMVKVNVKQE